MTEDLLAGDGRFGVVLIERGSEVGGGDLRVDVGTEATVVQAAPFPDGRWAVLSVGTRRLRVVHWLPDDPYPRAEVEIDPDDGAGSPAERLAEVEALVRRALALKAELGDPAAKATVELPDDADQRAWALCAAAPVGPADAQRLLEHDGHGPRLEQLHAFLVEEVAVLAHRLAGA
jgi:Lon protease-like protein